MKLLFCGDIMPGGVLPYNDRYISKEMQEYLQSFDLIVGTLETAIGTNIPFDEVKMSGRMNIIYSRNEDFYRIKELGVNIVSLANNHIGDLGEAGLANTIEILKENNVRFCGAGHNIEEASQPLIIEHNDKKIVILAYCSSDPNQVAYVPVATKDSWGINPFDINTVNQDIKKYKAQCDYVIVMAHWGKEYSSYPMKEIKRYSYAMANSGADIIIGTHTHSVQPHITHKRTHIYYSLGNFLFPDFYMHPPRPIYYPMEEEIPNIKTSYTYPFPVTEPLKRVWKPQSRLGMVAEVEISNKIRVTDKYLVLDSNNVLYPYSNKMLELKLKLIGALVKLPFYNEGKYIALAKRIVAKIKRTIYKV